jgi:hypothetical protein
MLMTITLNIFYCHTKIKLQYDLVTALPYKFDVWIKTKHWIFLPHLIIFSVMLCGHFYLWRKHEYCENECTLHNFAQFLQKNETLLLWESFCINSLMKGNSNGSLTGFNKVIQKLHVDTSSSWKMNLFGKYLFRKVW